MNYDNDGLSLNHSKPTFATGTVAKRAVRNLGDMVGEEVAMTVQVRVAEMGAVHSSARFLITKCQDFKEKGAVGAVKDAVADVPCLAYGGCGLKIAPSWKG